MDLSLRWLTAGLLMILVGVSTLILRELHQLRLLAQAAPLPAAQAAGFTRFASLPAAQAIQANRILDVRLVGIEYDGKKRYFGPSSTYDGNGNHLIDGVPVLTKSR